MLPGTVLWRDGAASDADTLALATVRAGARSGTATGVEALLAKEPADPFGGHEAWQDGIPAPAPGTPSEAAGPPGAPAPSGRSRRASRRARRTAGDG
jgi:hypothetical protein